MRYMGWMVMEGSRNSVSTTRRDERKIRSLSFSRYGIVDDYSIHPILVLSSCAARSVHYMYRYKSYIGKYTKVSIPSYTAPNRCRPENSSRLFLSADRQVRYHLWAQARQDGKDG